MPVFIFIQMEKTETETETGTLKCRKSLTRIQNKNIAEFATGIIKIKVRSFWINIFSIAGSKSHAIAEVLNATIIENIAAKKILLINLFVYSWYSLLNIFDLFILIKLVFQQEYSQKLLILRNYYS